MVRRSEKGPKNQIRIKGHLDRRWTGWFEGLTITPEDNGETLLTGPVVDQAAPHGLLKKVRDLGMPLLSVVQSKNGCGWIVSDSSPNPESMEKEEKP